jgi:hypothetical protein
MSYAAEIFIRFSAPILDCHEEWSTERAELVGRCQSGTAPILASAPLMDLSLSPAAPGYNWPSAPRQSGEM